MSDKKTKLAAIANEKFREDTHSINTQLATLADMIHTDSPYLKKYIEDNKIVLENQTCKSRLSFDNLCKLDGFNKLVTQARDHDLYLKVDVCANTCNVVIDLMSDKGYSAAVCEHFVMTEFGPMQERNLLAKYIKPVNAAKKNWFQRILKL